MAALPIARREGEGVAVWMLLASATVDADPEVSIGFAIMAEASTTLAHRSAARAISTATALTTCSSARAARAYQTRLLHWIPQSQQPTDELLS